MLQFTKMNGAGNDFVMFDNRDGRLHLTQDQIARVCDRHRGVGADGVLIVEPAQQKADFRMRYYNADGGEAEMCGNGARCFARFAGRLTGRTGKITFETMAGTIGAEFIGDQVRLAMSTPKDIEMDIELPIDEMGLVSAHFVNTGVPHAVVLVSDLEQVDVAKLGAAIRYHDYFSPKGTNANFAQAIEPGKIAIRTYERGVEGETLACGTGVTAAALMHNLVTGTPSPIAVRVRGGDDLTVSFKKSDGGFEDVTLTGPADFVFDGQISV